MADNPYYPLPRDYPSLTDVGKKLARVATVADRRSPDHDVASWLFFRSYYLNYPGAHWFDQYREPAPGHLEWVRVCARFDRVVIAAHRGSAKSTIFTEFSLRDLVSKPNHRTLLVNSTLGKITKNVGVLMRQLSTNQRLIEDFGDLRPPPRSWGTWNHEHLVLRNGAELRGLSVRSTDLRGERPHRALVDDPEYDQKSNTSTDMLIEYMDQLMTGLLIPMMRAGSCLHWIGTPVSARTFIYRLVSGELDDPRFDPAHWYRAMFPGEDGHGHAFWPAECPPAELARKRREMGAKYGPEFLCQPHLTLETPLHLDNAKHTYVLAEAGDIPPHNLPDPLESPTIIVWNDARRDSRGTVSLTPARGPAGEVFGKLMRFFTVDACRKPSPSSDFSAIHVLGVDGLNQLWSLDLWLGRVGYGIVCREIWRLALKWRPRLIGVEAIALEQQLLNEVRESAADFAQKFGWVPTVRGITYPAGVKKEERIMGIGWRFDTGLVKLPLYREADLHYKHLFTQIAHFTPGGEGLTHDDAVDTLAMSSEIVKGSYVSRTPAARRDPRTITEFLDAGKLSIAGVPIICGLDLTQVPEEPLARLLRKRLAVLETPPTDTPPVFSYGG